MSMSMSDINPSEKPKQPPTKELVVVAYGGGTNSTAMLIWMHENGLRPDCVLFADTGAEKPGTYTHVSLVNDWCISVGFPEIKVVKKAGKVYAGETLEEDCLRRSALPSIAYGFKTCSQKYKGSPQDIFLNSQQQCQDTWKAGKKVMKLIGFDAGEAHRAKDFISDKYLVDYPLIRADWGREECVLAIARAGLPQPGKSACFFCPSSKKAEILALHKDHPDLMARALKMEDRANLTSIKGLGRSFSWRSFIESQNQSLEVYSDAGKAVDCGCYDGDD